MPVTRPALPPRYASPEPIASGGMGEVYRATDATLGRTVAVKVLSERWASHDEFHARFLREARTAANLSGEPHVISIYDVSETGDGLPFIVMEYATHGTVGDRLERGAVPSEEALRWLEQAAQALDSAHARGVVHRDVKPANLLIADDETIRVSDFGIARAADQDTLTEVGSVLGSVGYMLRSRLPAGVPVGTVDRFQGQQAPVVLVSMASSSPDDAPRGIGFAFDRHRFNVATSRAQCRAVLVCSPRLLDADCRTVAQMRLVSAVCRFVELASLSS